MKHKKILKRRAFEAAAIVSKRKNSPGHPLNDRIERLDGDIRKVFSHSCRKHNNNMKAVWTELHAHLKKEGKNKTVRALREAADRMSSMTVKDAVKVLEGLGLDIRRNTDIVITVEVDDEKISIVLPNNHSAGQVLKNKDYATRVVCAVIGMKGNEVFDYLQKEIGNKATKGLFRKATQEMAA